MCLFLIFNIEHFQQFSNYPRDFFRTIFRYTNIIYLYKMKKLDSNNLFAIFSQGDEEVYKENNLEEMLDNSFVLFGMTVKGVENYFIIDQLYTNRYGEQYQRIRESIKLKYLLGLMKHLERIENIPSDTLHILQDRLGLQAINYALEELLDFFEKIEYYEQCALIKKYFDLFLEKKLLD